MPDPTSVRAMFGRIAGRYDLLNRLLSFGIDRRWRRAVVTTVVGDTEKRRGFLVVDACCGTGDLSVALADAGARAVGVDFTPEMVALAQQKSRPGGARFAVGDALRLPLPDACADAATVAFGIRNVADPGRGLRELARVVRPGGRVFALEFSMPPNPLVGWVYRVYFTAVLPVLGGLVSGDRGAYRYLPHTVLEWPGPAEFQRAFERAGLVDCGYRALTFGVACLHWGRVPAAPAQAVPGAAAPGAARAAADAR